MRKLVCCGIFALPFVATELFAEPAAPPVELTHEQAVAAVKSVRGEVIDYQSMRKKPGLGVWLQDATLVNDDTLQILAGIEKLWRVDIVYPNKVTDAGMQYVAQLATLEELNLEGTEISDAGLEPIGRLKSLVWLSLIDTNITSAGLRQLKALPQLKHLKLSFTDIDDSGLPDLAVLKNLRSLELDDTKVTADGVKKLRQEIPECKILASIVDAANVAAKPALIEKSDIRQETDRSAAGSNGDWPQWRGPHRDGVNRETRLLQEWPAEGPPLRWKTKGVGWGYSTVVTQAGMAYTSGCFDGKAFVTALDEKTGELRWQVEFAPEKRRTFSTPTIDGSRVYALSSDGDLACLDMGSKQVVWRRNLVQDFGGKFQSPGDGGGFAESVLVDAERLICTPGGPEAMMAALDKLTGATIWQAKMPPEIGPQGNDLAGFSSPVISDACGMRQYVQNTGCGLVSVSTSGKVLWTYNGIANIYGNIPTPIVRGDFVFGSNAHANEGDSGTVLLKVTSSGEALKAEEVYRLPERLVANHHGGMVLVGDYVYMGHGYNRGFPLCLEFATGKVKWRPGRGAGTGSASLVYADGRLYFHYEDGTVALVEASPEKYVLKGKFKGPPEQDLEWSHPVVSNGNLFIRGQNVLRCYDVSKH